MTVFLVILGKVWILENGRQDKQKNVESEEKAVNTQWGSCWGATATMLVKDLPHSRHHTVFQLQWDVICYRNTGYKNVLKKMR